MAIFVSDFRQAGYLWPSLAISGRDVTAFELIVDRTIPDGDARGPSIYLSPALLDDIFKLKNARSKTAILKSQEGALIELQQCENPRIKSTPAENLGYGHAGFHELGLVQDDIDAFFDKVQTAGYKTQTEHIWPCANTGRSFIFYDNDGSMSQMWQHVANTV